MTRPDVPLRMELTFELPGTPEQVWDAIATANGVSAWFIPTEMDEHVGGAVVFHMGEDESRGTITNWEPTRRIVYEEPEWATLAGHDADAVTPLVTEFLVEAKSGGTCVLRVVSSAFGTGADWEQEFFEQMEEGWTPYFDNLRLYLVHFPGQQVTSMSVDAQVPGSADTVWSTMCKALGADGVGQSVSTRGITAQVERITARGHVRELLLRLDAPMPGFMEMTAYDVGDDKAIARIEGYFFSEDAREYVQRQQAGWKEWLERLAVPAA